MALWSWAELERLNLGPVPHRGMCREQSMVGFNSSFSIFNLCDLEATDLPLQE